jgi:hypothetical protein
MYVGAMFMAGWTILLAWGAIKPVERRDLLLITSMLLFLSVFVELVFYGDMLGGSGFIFGVWKRIFLSVVATEVYIYSFRNHKNPHSTQRIRSRS